MTVFINDLKKDLHELMSIKNNKELDAVEIITINRQMLLIEQIIDEVSKYNECIIEEEK